MSTSTAGQNPEKRIAWPITALTLELPLAAASITESISPETIPLDNVAIVGPLIEQYPVPSAALFGGAAVLHRACCAGSN